MALLLRLILLVIVAWIAFRFLQRLLGLPSPAPRREVMGNGKVMRRCALCQVHVPEGESTQSRGQFFCCEAHRDAFLREHRH